MIDQADALLLFTRAQVERIPGNFEIEIALDERNRSGDLDNRCKAVLDYLERVTVIADDRLCDRLIASWGEAPHGCVTVRPVEQLDLQLTDDEQQMIEAAPARWAQQRGVTQDELEDRLGQGNRLSRSCVYSDASGRLFDGQ